MTDLDVVIIGAGPVGMTAAAVLGQWGTRLRIVDKKPGPVQHSQAAGVQTRTLELLHSIGLADRFVAAGNMIRTMHIDAYGERLPPVDLGRTDSPYAGSLVLGQDETERLLVERLGELGVSVERPVEATAISQDADGVSVEAKHPDGRVEQVRARYSIGCEGSGSLTRKSLDIPFEGERYAGEVFLQADATLRWTYGPQMHYFLRKDLCVIVAPFDDEGRVRVVAAMPDTDPDDHNPPALDEVEAILRREVDPQARLSEPNWLNRYRGQHRIAARYRDGRCFVAGDAGHVHIPVGGQGMNTGMQDAFNLAWKLALVTAGEAEPSLLDTYHDERHPVAENLIRFTDEGFHTLVRPSTLRAWATKHLGPVAYSLEGVRDRMAVTLGELDVAYHDGPLVEGHRGRGLTPGRRVPDAVVVEVSGMRPTRLFDVLRGPKWTLLLFAGADAGAGLSAAAREVHAAYEPLVESHWLFTEGPPPDPRPAGVASVLADRDGTARDKYSGGGPGLVLVRPDGHVGFQGGPDDGAALLAYLRRVLIGRKSHEENPS